MAEHGGGERHFEVGFLVEDQPAVARGYGAAWLAACLAGDAVRQAERVADRVIARRQTGGLSRAKSPESAKEPAETSAPIKRDAR